jgi:hypothetical protein
VLLSIRPPGQQVPAQMMAIETFECVCLLCYSHRSVLRTQWKLIICKTAEKRGAWWSVCCVRAGSETVCSRCSTFLISVSGTVKLRIVPCFVCLGASHLSNCSAVSTLLSDTWYFILHSPSTHTASILKIFTCSVRVSATVLSLSLSSSFFPEAGCVSGPLWFHFSRFAPNEPTRDSQTQTSSYRSATSCYVSAGQIIQRQCFLVDR